MLAIQSNAWSTMKVGLKTSNLPDTAIDDIFTEGKSEKIISGQDGDEQIDPTEDPTVEQNNLLDITDADASVLEFQEVTEMPRFPSICAQQKNKITEKRKIVKSNLRT